MAISMLKIRRPLGRLIFNMGIAIPGKTVFLIETAPWNDVCNMTSNKPRQNATNGKPEHEYWNVLYLVTSGGPITDMVEL